MTGTSASHASTYLQILLFVLIIGMRLAKKTRPQPIAEDRRRFRLPIILTGIGAYGTVELTKGAHPLTLTTADLGYLVLAGAVSLALGLYRGTTIRIHEDGGVLTQQYTGVTVGLWLATVVVRLGMDVAATHVFGVASAVTGTSILMMFGLSLLGESLMVAKRTGLPAGLNLGR